MRNLCACRLRGTRYAYLCTHCSLHAPVCNLCNHRANRRGLHLPLGDRPPMMITTSYYLSYTRHLTQGSPDIFVNFHIGSVSFCAFLFLLTTLPILDFLSGWKYLVNRILSPFMESHFQKMAGENLERENMGFPIKIGKIFHLLFTVLWNEKKFYFYQLRNLSRPINTKS